MTRLLKSGLITLASHRMVWLRAVGRRPQENTKKRDDYEKPFKILSSGFSNLDLFDSDLQPAAYSLQPEASLWDASGLIT